MHEAVDIQPIAAPPEIQSPLSMRVDNHLDQQLGTGASGRFNDALHKIEMLGAGMLTMDIGSLAGSKELGFSVNDILVATQNNSGELTTNMLSAVLGTLAFGVGATWTGHKSDAAGDHWIVTGLKSLAGGAVWGAAGFLAPRLIGGDISSKVLEEFITSIPQLAPLFEAFGK